MPQRRAVHGPILAGDRVLQNMNEGDFLQEAVVVRPSAGVASALAEIVVAVLIIDMAQVVIVTTGTRFV